MSELSEYREGLGKALGDHIYPGEVMTALDEAWIDCSCGERIPVPVVDLKVRGADVTEAFHTHAADALLASPVLAQIVADAKAEALLEARDDLSRDAIGFRPGWGSGNCEDHAALDALGKALNRLDDRAARIAREPDTDRPDTAGESAETEGTDRG